MKYAHLDKNNYLLGWYDDEIHDVIPMPNIQVTDEEWQTAIDSNANFYDGSAFVYKEPPKTPEELAAEAKALKIQQVSQITVTTTSGKTFDGNEEAQNRMARAVTASAPGDTTQWKLADNSIAIVTYDELKEALGLAGEAMTAIWMV